MNHVRTCLGCRTRADKSALLRVVGQGGDVVPDPFGRMPGRGGWVHPTHECIDKAISRKAFGRALKLSVVHSVAQIEEFEAQPVPPEEQAD